MTQIAREKLKGPILGIKITAALGLIYCLFNLVMTFLGSDVMYESTPEEWRGAAKIGGIVGSLIGIGAAVFLWIAAGKMDRLESHNLALIAAIVAMVPCVSPCCCIGLPVGIWAVIMLGKPEVKGAFTG